MKLSLGLIGVLLFILVLGTVFIWKFTQKTTKLPQQTTEVSTTTSSALFKVNPLQANVLISTTTLSEFTPISKTSEIETGSKIKTNISGRALIESSSNHKTLVDYNSEIVVTDNSKTEKKSKIKLLSGAVWARLEKVFDSGEYYEIKTSNAVATVRGTSFGVWYSNHTTRIIVTEGSIFMSKVSEETGEIIPDTEVVVNAGSKAVLTGNGDIKVSSITQADTSSAWYIYNNPNGKITPPTSPSPTTPAPTLTPVPTPQPTPTPNPPTASPATLQIKSMTPSSVTSSSGQTVSIKGQGFLKVKSLFIGKKSVQNFRILSDILIQIKIENISPGTYDVSLASLDNVIVNSETLLIVTAPPTPPPPVETYPENYQ